MVSSLVPEVADSGLRDAILAVLRRGQVGLDRPDVPGLQRKRARLEGKIEMALETLGTLGGPAAQRLGDKINDWSREQAEIDERIAQVGEVKDEAGGLETMADGVLELLGILEELREDTSQQEKRAFFHRAVDRVDMRFQTVPPAKGRKRSRHLFVKASVQANSLLGIAQEAVCSQCVLLGRGAQYNSTAFVCALPAVLQPGQNPAAVKTAGSLSDPPPAMSADQGEQRDVLMSLLGLGSEVRTAMVSLATSPRLQADLVCFLREKWPEEVPEKLFEGFEAQPTDSPRNP